jgi:hypothetical protein
MLDNGFISFHGEFGALLLWSLSASGASTSGNSIREPTLQAQILGLDGHKRQALATRNGRCYHHYSLPDPEAQTLVTLPPIPSCAAAALYKELSTVVEKARRDATNGNSRPSYGCIRFHKTPGFLEAAFIEAAKHMRPQLVPDAVGYRPNTHSLSSAETQPNTESIAGKLQKEMQPLRLAELARCCTASPLTDAEQCERLQQVLLQDNSQPTSGFTDVGRHTGCDMRPTASSLADALLLHLLRECDEFEAGETPQRKADTVAQSYTGEISAFGDKSTAWAAAGRAWNSKPTSCSHDHDACCGDIEACSGDADACGATAEATFSLFAVVRSLYQSSGLLNINGSGSSQQENDGGVSEQRGTSTVGTRSIAPGVDVIAFLLKYAADGCTTLLTTFKEGSAARKCIADICRPHCEAVRLELDAATTRFYELASSQMLLTLPPPMTAASSAHQQCGTAATLEPAALPSPPPDRNQGQTDVQAAIRTNLGGLSFLAKSVGPARPEVLTAGSLEHCENLNAWLASLPTHSTSGQLLAIEAIDAYFWDESSRLNEKRTAAPATVRDSAQHVGSSINSF